MTGTYGDEAKHEPTAADLARQRHHQAATARAWIVVDEAMTFGSPPVTTVAPSTDTPRARPRGARPRARRVARSTTRSGDSGDSDGEPGLGDPPPRRRPLEARYPWRVWWWERGRALDALAGSPERQLALDTEGTS
jgi:hypothetical protein